MSAPTPAPGDESPREGYYPDPSIPGYVRYWNGASWVPGTSRPAPQQAAPGSPGSPQAQAQAPAPAPATPSAPMTPAAPVTPADETGPIFFDEEDDATPASSGPSGSSGPAGPDGPEAASVWQADTARQTGFGGERDRRVSWGGATPEPGAPAPQPGRPADPRAAAASPPVDPRGSVAQDPTGGALPGMRDGGDRAPVPAGSRPPTEGTVTIRAVGRGSEAGPSNRQEAGSAPGEGTMTIRAPGAGGRSTAPGTAQPDSGAPQGPQTPQAPQPIPAARNAPAAPTPTTSQAPTPAPAPPATPHGPLQGPVQVPAPAPAPAPTPAPASSTAPEPAPAALHSPLTPGPGGGSASWAQQVHQLAQPDPQQAPQQPQQSRSPGADQQPVVPWKPPVDDPFQQLARSQASARPAGLGKRLAARLVDNLVLGAAVGAVALPLTAQALDHIDRKITAAERTGETVTVWLLDATTGALLGAVLGAFLLLGFLLEALPTAKWGRTLGKKLFGLDVRDIESHDTPSLGAALRRWLVYGVLGVLALGVVNVLWCLFDRPWRQCWHDKAARTFVAG